MPRGIQDRCSLGRTRTEGPAALGPGRGAVGNEGANMGSASAKMQWSVGLGADTARPQRKGYHYGC